MSEIRDKIIKAGTQAIIDKSYNSVGLNEILKSVKVPKGSFYHYFQSKEELGVCVIEQSASDHTQKLREVFSNRKLSPIERLRSFYESARDHVIEQDHTNKCLISKMALEVGCLSAPMRNAIKYGMDQWRTLTAQCIQEGQDLGEIRRELDAETLAEFIISTWEGVMMRAQAAKSAKPINDYLEIVFNRLLKAT